MPCLQYEGGEPCSVCGHRLAFPTANSQRASAFPSAILPSFLYLGSYDHASRSDALKMLEITHILNVSPVNQYLLHSKSAVILLTARVILGMLSTQSGEQGRVLRAHCLPCADCPVLPDTLQELL